MGPDDLRRWEELFLPYAENRGAAIPVRETNHQPEGMQMRVIVRMWNSEGYHKDVAILDEEQVRMHMAGMESQGRHLIPPFGSKVVVDPKQFPEAVEFEVIVERPR